MTPPPLAIRLFGPLRVTVCGEPWPRVRTRSVEWLLALLTLRHRGAVNRSWLAGTLWPESSGSRALQNLRNDLVALRQALGPERGRIQSPALDSLHLDLTGAAVDVLQFDAAIQAGDAESLRGAVELYTGPLLEECLEAWAFTERAARAEQFLAALEALADEAARRGDHGEAIRYLHRAEALDPLRDSLVQRLMASLATAGDPAAAIQTYRDFRIRLQEELAAAPDEATTCLFQEIRAAARAQAAQRRLASVPVPAPVTGVAPGVRQDGDAPRGAGPRGLRDMSSRLVPELLPRPLTSLIGRDQEAAQIREALQRSALVTLVGGGGVGKTRLALEVATRTSDQCSGEAVWVELGPRVDGALVLPSVAAALGLRDEGDEPGALTRRLAARLSDGGSLLVLDNCEHLLDAAAAVVGALLQRCPELRILATSRQRLGLPGEVVWRVPSLAVPGVQVFRCSGVPAGTVIGESVPVDPEHLNTRTPEHLMQYAAVRLFVERAAAVRPGFRLASGAEAAAVGLICRRLDGIPLAIELAAARTRVLTPSQIAARLDDRFALLTGGARGALPRHQTLRALIDWSYDSLPEPEAAVLRRLSVFAGGWTLEAAEAVCGGRAVGCQRSAVSEDSSAATDSRRLTADSPDEVLNLLDSLVDRSLVLVDEVAEGLRYRLLETVREYAQDRLLEAGEAAAVRGRHRDWFLAFAEQAEPELRGSEQVTWLERLEAEHDNLRAALAWCQSAEDDGELGLRLGAALGSFWLKRSYLAEGWGQLVRLLALPAASRPLPTAREDRSGSRWQLAVACARARAHAGVFALLLGNFEAAHQQLEESLARGRALDDKPSIALALSNMGTLAQTRGHLEAARERFEEALAITRDLGDQRHVASLLVGLAGLVHCHGDVARAHSLYQEGRLILQTVGDVSGSAWAGAHLAGLSLTLGDSGAARSLAEESLTLFRALDDAMGISSSLHLLGRVALAQGSPAAARSRHEEALRIAQELGSKRDIIASLHYLGDVSLAERDLAGAGAFYEQGLAISRELDYRPGIADALRTLGTIAHRRGDNKAAQALHQEGLALRREQGERAGLPDCLEGLGAAVGAQGQPEAAARLFGAAEALRVSVGTPLMIEAQADYDHWVADARTALGAAAFAAAWAKGRAMSLEEALEYALGEG